MKWRHQESKERREGGREEWSTSSFLNVGEEEEEEEGEGEVKVERVEEELVSEVAADSTVDSALELVIPRNWRKWGDLMKWKKDEGAKLDIIVKKVWKENGSKKKKKTKKRNTWCLALHSDLMKCDPLLI